MKAFILLSLFFSLHTQAESDLLNDLNGSWASAIESYPPNFLKRTLKVKYPSYTMVSFLYNSKNSKMPFLSQTTEGVILKRSQSTINELVENIDLSITRNELNLEIDAPQLKKLDIKQCAKVGTKLDILASGCGYLKSQKNVNKIFQIIMFMNKNSLLIGSFMPFPNEQSSRPTYLVMPPLHRTNNL